MSWFFSTTHTPLEDAGHAAFSLWYSVRVSTQRVSAVSSKMEGLRTKGRSMRVIKSPELLESERAAREQSAIELIAQGLITVPLSARQQQAYDDAVLYAAELDARERAYYEQLPARIVADNKRITDALNTGRLYLANGHGDGGTPTIHFASCFTVRHQMDRDIAHGFGRAADAEEPAGSWHASSSSDFVAKWPNLMTLDEVEALPSYRACQNCNPDTKERRKTPAPKIKPSKLSSINVDRIGRHYETASGEYLGSLESYTVTADLIVLHCTERDYRGTRDSLVVLLPK